jgi:hypothetical protein
MANDRFRLAGRADARVRTMPGRVLVLMPGLTRVLASIMILLASSTAASAQERGWIRGRVTDAATGAPLEAVAIGILGLQDAVLTRPDGVYTIRDVPPGQYVLVFEVMGYAPLTRPDVVVNPGRATQADAELRVAAVDLGGIRVSPGWFPEPETQPASSFSLNAEEIRRAPGSAGDVSRVLFALPSTATVADNANDLMVRGGSPMENGFYIDHIQVPNINHFPTVGSTGGPIGMVDVEFIDDVAFAAGGFSSAFGDRLSSVVDIDLRDGSRERVQTRLGANMSGFGGTLEGPLGDRASGFISARRSYIDLLVDAIGTGVAPRYGDLHAKLTYDPDASNTVSVLGLFGTSAIAFDREESVDNGNPSYGENRNRQGTVGVTWKRLWGERGYSVTAVSVSALSAEHRFFRTTTRDSLIDAEQLDAAVRVRTVNRLRLAPRSSIEFGADLEVARADYDYVLAADLDRLGHEDPRLVVDDAIVGVRVGAFMTHTWAVTPRWDIVTGIRGDYYDGLDEIYLSPRVSSSYRASDRLTVNAAGGLYSQRLPLFLLGQNPAFESLPAPRAVHAVMGFDYLVTPSTQLTLEAYSKWYHDLPLELEDPTLFVLDEGNTLSGPNFFRTLAAEGEARAEGVEVMVQKKLARDIYGLVSAAATRSRYRDLEGVWRSRAFENRYLFNLVGGYRPSHHWEVSARWTWADGTSYTPFDVAASTAADRGIIDASRILAERYPDYHALNLRLDRRFVFRGSALTVNASLWNVYDRRNIAGYYWNEIENRQDELLQWTFFPVIGMEWEL